MEQERRQEQVRKPFRRQLCRVKQRWVCWSTVRDVWAFFWFSCSFQVLAGLPLLLALNKCRGAGAYSLFWCNAGW